MLITKISLSVVGFNWLLPKCFGLSCFLSKLCVGMHIYICIYYIKLKSRLSVRLSVRTFLVEWISAVGAQIDVKLARNEVPVFWADEVYF